MDKDYIPLEKPFPQHVTIDPNKGFVPATAQGLDALLTRYYNRLMRRKYR